MGRAAKGILAAAAVRCAAGEMQVRPAPNDENEKQALTRAGLGDTNRVYRAAELVRGDNVMFAATGVTDGDMLNGVRYRSDGAITHSVVMRKLSGTRRFITTEHFFSENPKY